MLIASFQSIEQTVWISLRMGRERCQLQGGHKFFPLECRLSEKLTTMLSVRNSSMWRCHLQNTCCLNRSVPLHNACLSNLTICCYRCFLMKVFRIIHVFGSLQVWHSSRERLSFWTPGSVLFETCLCSNCWDQFSRTCQAFPWRFLGTFSILLSVSLEQ